MAWSDGRVKAFITSVLRAGARKWPPRYTVLNNAKVGKKINEKTGRIAEHYKCKKCNKHFVAKDVQVDHIEPVIDPRKGFISWDVYIGRLFCKEDNLQVMCIQCHLEKSNKEKQLAKETKQMVVPKRKTKERK